MHKKVIYILLTALLIFIVLSVLVVSETAYIQAFNDTTYAPVSEMISPTLTAVSIWIGRIAHVYGYVPILLLLLIIPKTRMKVGLPLAATLAVSQIIGPFILKNIFAIERPTINQLIYQSGYGYPSGHSLGAAVFFGMCSVFVARYSSKQSLRISFTIFAAISIIIVGLSRIYLGVHTAADVAGGYLAGCVIVCAYILIENRLKQRLASGSS